MFSKSTATMANKQERATAALVDSIVSANLPFHLLDNDDFRRFTETLSPDFKLPHRDKAADLISDKFNTAVSKLIQVLATAVAIAITSDSATTVSRDSLFAVTCHWINPETWQLMAVVIGVTLMDESHTAVNVSAFIANLLARIKDDKTFCALVTDAAANMLASGRMLRESDMIDESMRCACHTFHLCVTHALDHRELEPLISKCKASVNAITNSANIAESFRKFQLAEHSEYKQAVDLYGDDSPEAEVHDDYSAPRPGKLSKDVATRWSSTLKMLTRLLQLRRAVNFALNEHDKDLFSNAEWDLITEIIEVLTPFADAVRELEGEQYPTLSLLLPYLCMIIKFLDGSPNARAAGNPSRYDNQGRPFWPAFKPEAVNLKQRLRDELGVAGRYDTLHDATKLAMAIDPRFKSLGLIPGPALRASIWTLLEKTTLEMAKQKRDRDAAVRPPDGAADPNPEPPAPNPEQPPAPRGFNLHAQMEAALNEERDPAADPPDPDAVLLAKVKHEIEEFQRLPRQDRKESPLEWWKTHHKELPLLSQVALRYLCIPASSAPSERVFSKVNLVATKTRNRLDPERIEALVFLRHNHQLLKQLLFRV